MKRYLLYIGGKWIEGAERRTIHSPYDGAPLAEVEWAGDEQVEAALEAARAAAELGRRSKTRERAQWLEGMRDGIARRHEEMARTISEEAGKPIAVARIEVDRGVNTFDLASKLTVCREDAAYPLDIIKYGDGRQCVTRRFPVGPVLGITPYNWPLNLGAHKIAPALAVGCPIILRPASQTPCSSLLLGEIAQEAGVAAGMYNVVPCPVPLVERMATDPRVKMVSFTGSPEVGWALKARAADKRVSLELGGNAACILEPETDLDFAVPRLASGAFGYAGQVCISVQRIIVHETIRDEFVARMSRHLGAEFKTGNPREEGVLCGPLIDKASTDKVMEWIEEAVGHGARVLCGGKRLSDNMIEPTLIEGVRRDLRLYCREVFGPVATVETYSGFDKALEAAGDSEYGINCGVFTNDINKAYRAFERLEVGCVIINDYPTFRVDRMPYGGVKRSGFGREGVQYAMEEMTEIKALILNLKT